MGSSAQSVQKCLRAVRSVVLSKNSATELAFAGVLARGSVLIEDRPGLGKTTLAKALSKVLGLSFQRIQCTNDLLPIDILGRLDLSVRDQPRLIEGPIFASIVLLDELNRAPPRTQSAFLQAMEEGEVSLEGKTYPLPQPQFFIATQNPVDQVGTSLLPESQLDRFTVHLTLGYPDPSDEKQVLLGVPGRKFQALATILSRDELLTVQSQVQNVKVSDSFLDLVIRFLNHVRSGEEFLSPRAGQDLVRVSQAIAYMRDRDFVTPDDFKLCLRAVVGHRVRNADVIIQRFSLEA